MVDVPSSLQKQIDNHNYIDQKRGDKNADPATKEQDAVWINARLHAGLEAQGEAHTDTIFVNKDGTLTKEGDAALRRFQKKDGAYGDGILGTQTLKHLADPSWSGGHLDTSKHPDDGLFNSAYSRHEPVLNKKGQYVDRSFVGGRGAVDSVRRSLLAIANSAKYKDDPKAAQLRSALGSSGLTPNAINRFYNLISELPPQHAPRTLDRNFLSLIEKHLPHGEQVPLGGVGLYTARLRRDAGSAS